MDYLAIENDWSGYDEKLGWIHTAAHGADFLLATSCHDQFPAEKSKEVWQTIVTCLTRQSKVFSAGEEIRLAQIPVYLLLNEKVTSKELTEWISKLDFPNQEPVDYFLASEKTLLCLVRQVTIVCQTSLLFSAGN
ncbi:DUF2785 domain-containing protein [Streptococcus suis]|uniref:DUF2785 domain-containing protein n=1 Tax=Streptococcus suis TaxID=1307 RepID=UPI002E10566C